MKQRLQGLFAGVLIGTILTSGIAIATNSTTLYNVITNGIKIFVDGQKLNPKDANGNIVEPFIYNGTTYLPVRAVANALGKTVYWDESNYTVYLGNKEPLPYPSKEVTSDDNIGDYWHDRLDLKDNYGNTYTRAISTSYDNQTFEILCAMKYSRLKGTIYVREGYNGDETTQIIIKADGETAYKSPEINKTSQPIEIDVDISECNDLQITATHNLSGFWSDNPYLCIGDLSLYQ